MQILRWIGGLFLPMFTRPRISPGLLWFLHLLLIAAITVGLWYIGREIEVARNLTARWPFLKEIWMPLLFLLLYFIAWQAWWVWRLLQPESIASVFPDIDDAWGQVVESLQKAG